MRRSNFPVSRTRPPRIQTLSSVERLIEPGYGITQAISSGRHPVPICADPSASTTSTTQMTICCSPSPVHDSLQTFFHGRGAGVLTSRHVHGKRPGELWSRYAGRRTPLSSRRSSNDERDPTAEDHLQAVSEASSPPPVCWPCTTEASDPIGHGPHTSSTRTTNCGILHRVSQRRRTDRIRCFHGQWKTSAGIVRRKKAELVDFWLGTLRSVGRKQGLTMGSMDWAVGVGRWECGRRVGRLGRVEWAESKQEDEEH